MNNPQLPFVWEIKHNGMSSFAIGTMHYFPRAERYSQNITQYIRQAKQVMLETDRHQENKGIDDIISSIATAFQKPIIALRKDEDYQNRTFDDFLISELEFLPRQKEITPTRYARADEKTMAESLNEIETIKEKAYRGIENSPALRRNDNKLLFKRSLQHLTSPSIIAVGVGHFIAAAPTLLELYKENGIKIKRVQ
jgi:uncharacterized protein YbaP (TraB family)